LGIRNLREVEVSIADGSEMWWSPWNDHFVGVVAQTL
jgi:hypothetical protein